MRFKNVSGRVVSIRQRKATRVISYASVRYTPAYREAVPVISSAFSDQSVSGRVVSIRQRKATRVISYASVRYTPAYREAVPVVSSAFSDQSVSGRVVSIRQRKATRVISYASVRYTPAYREAVPVISSTFSDVGSRVAYARVSSLAAAPWDLVTKQCQARFANWSATTGSNYQLVGKQNIIQQLPTGW